MKIISFIKIITTVCLIQTNLYGAAAAAQTEQKIKTDAVLAMPLALTQSQTEKILQNIKTADAKVLAQIFLENAIYKKTITGTNAETLPGERVALINPNNEIEIWDLNKHVVIKNLGQTSNNSLLSYGKENNALGVFEKDKKLLTIFDLNSFQKISLHDFNEMFSTDLLVMKQVITKIILLPKNKICLYFGHNRYIRLISLSQNKPYTLNNFSGFPLFVSNNQLYIANSSDVYCISLDNLISQYILNNNTTFHHHSNETYFLNDEFILITKWPNINIYSKGKLIRSVKLLFADSPFRLNLMENGILAMHFRDALKLIDLKNLKQINSFQTTFDHPAYSSNYLNQSSCSGKFIICEYEVSDVAIINTTKNKSIALKIIKERPEIINLVLDEILKNFDGIDLEVLKLIGFLNNDALNKFIEHILRTQSEIYTHLNYFFDKSFRKYCEISKFGYLSKLIDAFFFSKFNYKKAEKEWTAYESARIILKQKALELANKIPGRNLDSISMQLDYGKERNEFQESISKIFNIGSFTLAEFIHEGFVDKIPDFVKSKLSLKTNTQSEAHAAENLSIIDALAQKYKNSLLKPEVKKFLVQIHQKEEEEIKKGNFVFYHGRDQNKKFQGEMFKELWKLKYSEHVPDDFIFFRYYLKENQPAKINNIRSDCLFMNHALFGNSHESTYACTISQYWLKNISILNDSNETFSTENLFKLFGYHKLFDKYQKEFANLETSHKATSQYGEIILIAIPEIIERKLDAIDLVRPIGPGGHNVTVKYDGTLITHDTKKILNVLKNDPKKITLDDRPNSSNYFEWALQLTKKFALDPQSGIKMYSFYLADEKKLAEYNQLKTALFEKIKKDIAQEKPLIKSRL